MNQTLTRRLLGIVTIIMLVATMAFGLAVTAFIGGAIVLLIRRTQVPLLARLLEAA